MPDPFKKPESSPPKCVPKNKEKAIARLIQENPEKAAEMLREMLRGNSSKK